MVKKKILLLVFFSVSVFSLFSGETTSSNNLNQEIIIRQHLNYWGVDTDLGFGNFAFKDNLDTVFWLSGGAGVRSLGYYRDEDDNYYEADDDRYEIYEDFKYFRVHTNWGGGITQGIFRVDGESRDLVSLLFKYRGVREWNFKDEERDQILFNSVRNDRDGVLVNSLIAALVFDTVETDPGSAVRSGIYSELSIEEGPEWFFNSLEGVSDFTKYYAGFTFFIPLKEFRNREGEKRSGLYLANYSAFDIVYGENIPMIARQKMGSVDPSNGLGGRIRGFETRRFDGELKVANNTELRLPLPAIKSSFFPNDFFLRPGALLFFDAGYYDLLKGSDPGALLSCGMGVYGDFSGFLKGMSYLSFPMEGERLDKKAMVLSFDVSFHF